MNNLFTASVVTTLLFTNYAPVHAAQTTEQEALSASTTNLTIDYSDLVNMVSVVSTDLTDVTVGAALNQPQVEIHKTLKESVNEKVAERFGKASIPFFDALITQESNWNPNAVNAASGACGLFQALPCKKMGGMDIATQTDWGLGYIESRYGSPAAAWAHERIYGWY